MNIFEGYPLEDRTFASWELKPEKSEEIRAARDEKGWAEIDWWNLDSTIGDLLYNALVVSLESEIGDTQTFLSAKLLNKAAEDFQTWKKVDPAKALSGAEYIGETLLAFQGYSVIRFDWTFSKDSQSFADKYQRMIEAMVFVLSSLPVLANIHEELVLSKEEMTEQRFKIGFALTDLTDPNHLLRVFSELLGAMRLEGNGYPSDSTPEKWDSKLLRAEKTVLAFGSSSSFDERQEFVDFLDQYALSLWD